MMTDEVKAQIDLSILTEIRGAKNCAALLLEIVELAESVLVSETAQMERADLLPDLYAIHARALQALSMASSFPIDEAAGCNNSRKEKYLLSAMQASRIAALRAIAIREDALEYYNSGWRVEFWTRKGNNGGVSIYAQFRRSIGNGKREAHYIGVVWSCKSGGF